MQPAVSLAVSSSQPFLRLTNVFLVVGQFEIWRLALGRPLLYFNCMNENITKKPKRPRDVNQLAAQIVAEAVGDVEPEVIPDNPLSERGRKGGLKGGKARAEKLTPEQRKEIAEMAAKRRWRKN